MFSQRLVRGKRFYEVKVHDDEHYVSSRNGPVGEEGVETKKSFETTEDAEKYAKDAVSKKKELGFIAVTQVKQEPGIKTRAGSWKRAKEEVEIALKASKKVRRSKRLSGGGFTQTDSEGRGVIDSECNTKGEIVSLDTTGLCDVMLAQVDTDAGVDNFVVLQLIQEKGRSDSFVVFKRCGVTGQVGLILEKSYRTLAESVLAFSEHFKQCTGVDWLTGSVKPQPLIATPAGEPYQRLVQDDAGRRALASENHGLWFYWVDDFVDGKKTGWYPYDDVGSRMTEKLFLESQLNTNYTQRVVKSGYYSYLVDLTTKTQTNISHPNRKMRQIRRKPYSQPLDGSPPPALLAEAEYDINEDVEIPGIY